MTISADHKKLIYSGRIDWSNPLEPIFVFPCTFVKMKFTGNVLKVHVKNRNAYWNNYLGVLLDGEVKYTTETTKRCYMGRIRK